MRRFVPAAVAAFLAGIAAMPARAATLVYQLTGDVNATWRIDTGRAPDDVRGDQFFGYYGVPLDVDGIHYDDALIFFFPSWALGGVEADLGLDESGTGLGTLFSGISIDPSAFNQGQLYTGTTADPVLLTGEWDLVDYGSFVEDPSDPAVRYHLSVTQAVSNVPEPASWAMLVAGFAIAGGCLRSKRRAAWSCLAHAGPACP